MILNGDMAVTLRYYAECVRF